MQLSTVKLEFPEGCNIILGMSHFIKTVEDLYEVMVNSVPGAKFGLAFCEASGPRLIRHTGSDKELESIAIKNAQAVGAGHSFVLIMRDCFPVNVLKAVQFCAETVNICCATANPVEVVIAESEQGRGILGVIDGFSPKGLESETDIVQRKDFLRKIGYKL